MDERPGWEVDPFERTGNEGGTPDGAPPLRDDAPTIPMQPIPAPPGRSAAQPEWPVAQPGRRRSNAQGPGYCFGVAIVGIVGVALVLALVAGTLFTLHALGSSAPSGENGLAASASQTAKAATATARPAQATPTPVPTATVTPTATSTATPLPPQLSVSPQQETGMCLLGHYGDLTLKNSGGSDLTWTATSSAANVKPDPASGTLAAGATQNVTLGGTHLGKSFTVTFSGNGGDATVTITCA